MKNQIAKLQTDHQTLKTDHKTLKTDNKDLKDMVMRLTVSLSTERSVSTRNVVKPPRAPTELSRLVETAIVDSESQTIISRRLNQLEIFSPDTLVAGTVYADFREFKTDMHLDPKVKSLGQVMLMRLWCMANTIPMP